MKTLSSMVTPSQTKVWLDILQRLPILAFFLHLNKCPDLCLVSDFATVKIDELGQLHIAAELYICRYTEV